MLAETRVRTGRLLHVYRWTLRAAEVGSSRSRWGLFRVLSYKGSALLPESRIDLAFSSEEVDSDGSEVVKFSLELIGV